MKNGDCLTITPGEPINLWQKAGLELVAHLHGSRDVVLAIDLTGSVDFNDEGRTRLHQIIQDSLQSGDSVYIVPFASQVNPLSPKSNSFVKPISFHGKKEDIENILNAISLQSKPNLRNTDIQRAELYIYRGVAQLNQCRLTQNKPIKSQSVVWITEAPLLDHNPFIETPVNSPFRLKNSPESKERQNWLKSLPLNKRKQQITTNNNKNYQLSIVDISPTVQEFCTPAPGGQEICSINSYLLKQLWFPTLIIALGFLAGVIGINYLKSLIKPWKLTIKFSTDDDREQQKCTLKNNQKIAIGDGGINCIYCPGENIRGYLERQGNQLYLKPTKQAPIYYRGHEITQKIKIEHQRLTINCPDESKANTDFDLVIQILKK